MILTSISNQKKGKVMKYKSKRRVVIRHNIRKQNQRQNPTQNRYNFMIEI